MDKRGVEHIEMILSFVIFAGALIIAFAYFKPFSVPHTSESLLDQIYANVEERVSTELVFASLVVNSSQISINHKFTLNMSKPFPEPWQVRAITASGTVLKSEITNRNVGEVEFDWSRSNHPFVTLIFGKDITVSEKPVNIKQPGINDYVPGANKTEALAVASVNSRKLLSEKKVIDLISAYQSNPLGTKQELGIPPEISYGFLFVSASGKMITDVPLQQALDFRIKSKRVDSILKNGTLEYSELGVGIW